jgi:hypothetical protein
MTEPQPPREDALKACFAEYTILYAERDNRTSIQTNLALASLTATGIILGVALTNITPVILVIPVLTGCLGLLWLDHAAKIDRIGSYVRENLSRTIRTLSDVPPSNKTILEWETHQNDQDQSKKRRTPRWGRLDLSILFSFAFPGLAAALIFIFFSDTIDERYSAWGWKLLAVASLLPGILFAYYWIYLCYKRA